MLERARDAGANLVVFRSSASPATSSRTWRRSRMRRDDRRLLELAALAGPMSAIVSFVEEANDHRLFIAAALLENGESGSSTASSSYRPTGSSTSGASLPPEIGCAPSTRSWGSGSESDLRGLLHMAVPRRSPSTEAAAHQRLVVARPGPGGDSRGRPRDSRLVANADADLRPVTTSFAIFCNRVGMDETISFWGVRK